MMNKPYFKNGDRVEVALAGYIDQIMLGTIIGKASEHVIDFWIVRFDKPLAPELNYPYEATTVQHTFIRKVGENRPFLCETGKFSYDILA